MDTNTSKKASSTNDFIKIMPNLHVNRSQIIWVQKYEECIYFSQTNKTHMVCNTSSDQDVYYKQLNAEFFETLK